MEIDASMVWAFLITIYAVGAIVLGWRVGQETMPSYREDDLTEYLPAIFMTIVGGLLWLVWLPFYGIALLLRHKNLQRIERAKREEKLREAAQDH